MTERAKHAARIRDQRQARDEVRPQGGSKRNTKKWCRGVVGRQHDAQWHCYSEYKHASDIFQHWSVLVCKNCGKELKIDYGSTPWWKRLIGISNDKGKK